MSNRLFAIGLGGVIGFAHIGILFSHMQKDRLPIINLPTGKYTSYLVEATKEGYKIQYRANDPLRMYNQTQIKKKSGFLGLGNDIITETEAFTSESLEKGGVSSVVVGETGKRSVAKTIVKEELAKVDSVECIKAEGSGESTGRLVGASVMAQAAPTLSSIPVVGFLAAGWGTMFGANKGADIGGTMAKSMKGC